MTMAMIERRRIEAEILKLVYEDLTERLGRSEARKIIDGIVRRSAIAQGESFRDAAGGKTSLQGFADLLPLWQKEDALRIEVQRQDGTHFDFNVVRCRYAEMYKEMGIGDIGHLLSCNRDGTFCEGYDPKLKLERSQTIMQGASHCDFRYTYDGDAEE